MPIHDAERKRASARGGTSLSGKLFGRLVACPGKPSAAWFAEAAAIVETRYSTEIRALALFAHPLRAPDF